MKFIALLLLLAVLWHDSLAGNFDVMLTDYKLMTTPGVFPVARTRRCMYLLLCQSCSEGLIQFRKAHFLFGSEVEWGSEYQGYFLSDGSVQLWRVAPGGTGGSSFQPIVSWDLPFDFQGSHAYHLQAMDPNSYPYPTVSWVTARDNTIWRFQCGPSTLCYRTAPDINIVGANSSHWIQGIINLQDGSNSGRMLAVSTDYVAVLDETPSLLVLRSVYSWETKPFRQAFPVTTVTGLVSTAGLNLLVSLSPDDAVNVGYVITLKYGGPSNPRYNYKSVTMMQRSTEIFNSWSSPDHLSPVFYWLEILPYNNSSTKNAFLKSHGGGGFSPTAAGTVFPPGTNWAHIFMLDHSTKTGLLASSNSMAGGFTAWSPAFSLGACAPEVKLRASSAIPPSSGWEVPRMGTYVWGQGRRASAVSRNSHNGRYYLVILDWSRTPPNSFGCSKLSTTDSKRDVQEMNYEAKTANCKPSQCGLLDGNADCPEEKCWGLGGVGGFFCCDRPPT